MAYQYQGHYLYNQKVVQSWDSNSMGVYYCGYVLPNGNLRPLYIGRATGEQGIRGRILQHLGEDHWPSVTHFGYSICQSMQEAILLESSELVACSRPITPREFIDSAGGLKGSALDYDDVK